MSVSAPATTLMAESDHTRRGPWRSILTFCRRQPLGTFGMALVIIVAIAGLGANLIAPYNPTANDFAAMTEAPSWAHWLGTDQFGRDMLSRIIFGARTALLVGLSSALVGGVAAGVALRRHHRGR